MVDYAEVAPQARPGAPREKPNRIHYLIGAIIILVGMVLAVRSIYKNIAGISNSLTRVVVPGQAEIELEEAGKYTIFHEYKTTIDGSVYWSKQDLSGLRCRLLSKATGEEIPLRLPAGETKYTLGSRAGVSVYTFRIDRPGTYVLTASYPREDVETPTALAIGRGFLGRLLGTVAWTLLVVLLSFGLGIAIIVVTFVRRSRADRMHSD